MAKQEKVVKLGVKRESGYLYYVDKDGDLSRAPMARAGKKKGKPEKVAKAGVKRESGWMLFMDKDGDIARTKMARAGKKVMQFTAGGHYLGNVAEGKVTLYRSPGATAKQPASSRGKAASR